MSVRWRCNAATNTNSDTEPQGYGVRELRPPGGDTDAREAEEKGHAQSTEKEQGQGLAFSLPAPLAFRSLSLLALPGEPIPSQATASNLTANNGEAFRIRQLPTVVAEGLFIQITEQMKRLNADIGSVKLTLHQAPEVFHRVRVDVAANVLYGVIHNGVLIFSIQPVVGLQRIAKQCGTSLYVLANLAMKFMFPSIRYGEGADVSAALHHTESDGLILATRTCNDFGAALGVHIAGLPAYERFVHFDFASEFRSGLVLHRFADSVKHEPSGFLSQPEVACDFAGANTIPAIGNQPHSREPFLYRDRGFIQDRPNLHRELFAAIRGAALPNAARFKEHRLLRGTVGALDPIGPTLRREVAQRIVRIAEVFDRFGQCLGGFHVQSMS